ncbi:MAG TPA: glycosyltransferase [Sphingomonas sp.]|nr:glycosyltransferase [Sphingomonas sp.]
MTGLYIYIHDFRSSGVVRDTLTYARLLAERFPTTVVAAYGTGFFRAEAERAPFRLVVLNERQGRHSRFAAIPGLRRWLRAQRPGLLLSMGVLGHPTIFLACQGLSHVARIYRISNEVAGPVKKDSALRRFWIRRLMHDAARLILVGTAMGRHDLFADAVRRGHAVTIPSGVDRRQALELSQADAPHPWLEDDIPIVVAIGRLRPQKNLELLIGAVEIARRSRRLRLIIIGGGTSAEQARMHALAAGFSADFLLAGETDNVFAWLSRADVFALPSRWEGSSLALLEAMAVGTPVVASRLAGDAADVLEDGRYGVLFEGQDIDALAAALLRQISDRRVMPEDRAFFYDTGRIADLYATTIAGALAERADEVADRAAAL